MEDASHPDPEDVIRMEDALRRMPRLQRAIFLAIRLDDLGYDEIARQTGLTPAQVERLVARAIGNVMRNLDNPNRCRWRRWFG